MRRKDKLKEDADAIRDNPNAAMSDMFGDGGMQYDPDKHGDLLRHEASDNLDNAPERQRDNPQEG